MFYSIDFHKTFGLLLKYLVFIYIWIIYFVTDIKVAYQMYRKLSLLFKYSHESQIWLTEKRCRYFKRWSMYYYHLFIFTNSIPMTFTIMQLLSLTKCTTFTVRYSSSTGARSWNFSAGTVWGRRRKYFQLLPSMSTVYCMPIWSHFPS